MAEAFSSRLKWFSLTALIVGPLAPVSGCQSLSPTYFQELKIDSGLHLVLAGGLDLSPTQEPSVGSYYAPFHGASVTSVDHWEKKPGAVSRERLLYLEAGRDQVLDRTVKTDEILRGPFGSVNAEKVCFYTRPIENGYGSVSVQFNNNDTAHELPMEVSGPPQGLPALTSVSLVRIFRSDQDYVIISANYEADGNLGSLNFGAAENGRPSPNSRSNTSMYRTPDPQVNDLSRRFLAPTLAKYGIPASIDVEKYLRSRTLLLPATSLHQERDVMNEFYGFGKFIRQDEVKDGAIVASRWLHPSETKEEKDTLNTLCDARFRKQQALGLPTVE